MKKTIKTLSVIFLFAAVIPALAGLAIMTIWNGVAITACGFAAISFWQAVGLFILGQILSGGFILALFLVGGGIHAASGRKGKLRNHWHNMTDEQRRDFIARRRAHFGFYKPSNGKENVTN